MPAIRWLQAEQRARRALVVVLGLAFGAAAFESGFYADSWWMPACLAFLAAALALWLGIRTHPPATAWLSVGGLAGLWLWSLISSSWADRADLALQSADRWALYAAIAATLTILVGGRERVGRWLLAACATGAIAVAAIDLIGMLTSSAPGLFLGATLNAPIGYPNGTANLLLLGFWPLVAVAAEVRRPLVAGLAIGGATAIGGVLLADQRRGTFLALAAGAVILIAVVPGRRGRVWALLAIVGAVALASGSITPVYQHLVDGASTAAAIHRAARASLLAGAALALVWAAALAAIGAVRARSEAAGVVLGRVGSGALAALAVIAIVGLVADAHQISHRVSDQYHAFVHLSAEPGSFRLFSGGGNRDDYWRVALKEFDGSPIRGAGAGNYDVGYYRDRHTTEDITQPHSIELQTLAELGLVGGLLLLAFVAGPMVGLWRLARRARAPGPQRLVAVGAGGMFLSWLAQTSVDWMHLIPSITALALGAGVVLASARRGRLDEATQTDSAGAVAEPDVTALAGAAGPRRRGGGRGRIEAWVAVSVAVTAAVAVAAFTTARMELADGHQTRAQHLLVSDPVAAVRQADDAIDLEGDSVSAYYLRSAALARLDLAGPAKTALRDAIAHGPSDWVSWALLGDLETRTGDPRAARRAYRRAAALDPLDAPVLTAPDAR
jgi:O-antigen ligase